MNAVLLWMVKIFNPIWRSMGVDLNQFYAILKAKLLMDGRRGTSMFGGVQSEKSNYIQYLVYGILFLFGAVSLGLFIMFEHTSTALTIYFAIWMVLLTMTIVMDYSDVLVDTKDNFTLLPTPITGVTLSTARMVRVMIFLFKQALAFSFPALIYMTVNKGVGILVFVFLSFLAIVMSLSLVTLIYLGVMMYSSPQRFKNIINYLQISFTVAIFGAYYLLPELIDFSGFSDENVFDSPFTYLAPPAWIASIWEMIFYKNFSTKIILHSILAVVGSIGAFVFISKYLSSNYSQRLFSIGQAKGNTEAVDESKASTQKEKPSRWLDSLANVVTFNKAENVLFKFCFRYTNRDRMYKLKTYPVLGYVPILLASMFLTGKGSFAERLAEIQAGDNYLFIIYGIIFIGLIPLTNSMYSKKPEQIWIFRATPIGHPKVIFNALFKVIFVKFVIPMWIIFLLFCFFFWGPKVIDDFCYGAIVITFSLLLLYRALFKGLPFSKPWSEMQGGGNFLLFLFSWILIGIAGFFHYWFQDYSLILIGVALILVAASFFIWRSFSSYSWAKIEAVY